MLLGKQNRTTRLSNSFGHVKIFSEKHIIELLVAMGTLRIGSMKSRQMKKSEAVINFKRN